ncbi:hypothetical protein [Nocardia sp. NPDC057030]|uniref:hypothetical protein n=1 Tax=unclassified Nocardia TaxID=2637762 RepID=UPI003632C66D
MRIGRARINVLLAAAILTAAGWVAVAPAAYAGPVETCIPTSATYEAFKGCYETELAGEQAAADKAAKDKAAKDAKEKKECEEDGGKWKMTTKGYECQGNGGR